MKKKEAMIAELSQQMKEAESTCRGLQERLAQVGGDVVQQRAKNSNRNSLHNHSIFRTISL